MIKELLTAMMLLAAVPALASADQSGQEPSRMGAYFSGFLGFNNSGDATLETTDYVFGDDRKSSVEFDPGIYIGGTGGYDFGMFRLEGELSYRAAELNNITSDRGVRYRRIDTNLGMLAGMVNCFFDLDNSTPVTPYLGGGVGFAALYLDNDLYDDNGDPVYYEDAATTFAVQVGGGVEFKVNRRFSLDLGYRYFKTGTATFDSEWDLENRLKVESHNVALGFRAKF